MKSKWNARADTASSIVLWGGSLLAGFICLMWLTKTLNSEQAVIQQVDNELSMLVADFNTACRMDAYWKNHYPKLSLGTVIIRDMSVCIDSSKCQVSYYSGEGDPVIEPGRTIVPLATECTNPKRCKRLYYSSDMPPQFTSEGLVVDNALECSDDNQPFLRCRTIYCSTGLSQQIFLRDVTSLNISKGGGFHVTSQ